MIWHQTPSQHINMWQYMQIDFLQEEKIIHPVKENLLPVIALIVNVVNGIFCK